MGQVAAPCFKRFGIKRGKLIPPPSLKAACINFDQRGKELYRKMMRAVYCLRRLAGAQERT